MQSTNTIKNTSLTRRSFLGVAFLGALAVLAAQSLAVLFRFLKPVSTGGFGGLVYAGKVDEFPVGSVNHILAGRCYLVRLPTGFISIWQRCTHLGCTVPWQAAAGEFHCPCHGSLFNTVGEVTGGPAPRPLDLFPVHIRSGEVWIDTSKPQTRSSFNPDQVTGA